LAPCISGPTPCDWRALPRTCPISWDVSSLNSPGAAAPGPFSSALGHDGKLADGIGNVTEKAAGNFS